MSKTEFLLKTKTKTTATNNAHIAHFDVDNNNQIHLTEI